MKTTEQMGQCPDCGEFKLLREQHRRDGSLPSQDRRHLSRRGGYYPPVMKCKECIEKYHRDLALRLRGHS